MKKLKALVPQKLINQYHLVQAVVANIRFGFPSKKLKIIGVTGTNGKTTTVQMITRILEEAGCKVAMASTINFKIAETEWTNDTKFTTLSSWKVQSFLKNAVEAGCEYAVLETSSHSLDQNRVWGVKYKTAVITNVTREHLDYHKNMEEYRIAKLKLFHRIQAAVVNLDMQNARDYLDCGNVEKYAFTTRPEAGVAGYDCGKIELVRAENIELGINYSDFEVNGVCFQLKLPGLFNVENALGAICAAKAEGIDLLRMKTALERITGVPGRMEHIQNDRGVDIIVDYAVTPDSLEKLYRLVSIIKCKSNIEDGRECRIISVFGSCGDRDRGKRPAMGKIVDQNAGYIILTNEDPYTEDPWQIINEVASGIKDKKEDQNFWKILDRRQAIRKALELAVPGDIVVVTGKGAEETMMVGGKMIPWNDKKVILEELAAIKQHTSINQDAKESEEIKEPAR